MANEHAFQDALELLTGPVEFWVASFEDIFSPAEDKYVRKFCLYHWLTDVYCFMIDKAIGITFSNPHDADVVHYSTAHDIAKAYREVLEKVTVVHNDILKQDTKAG